MDLKAAEQTVVTDALKGASFLKAHWVWAGPALGVLVGFILAHIL